MHHDLATRIVETCHVSRTLILGLLAEKQFGRIRLFVNGDRWTVDASAPLEGRNINGGLRLGS